MLQHKAAARDAKARLDELLRASRVGGGRASATAIRGGAAPGASHGDGASVETARRVMELQKELDALRKDNVRLMRGGGAPGGGDSAQVCFGLRVSEQVSLPEFCASIVGI